MLATTRTGQFCTSLDVTLRQHGSGGKTHLGRIARRGDPYWPCRRSHLQCSDAYHLLHYDTGQLQPISFHWLFCSNKVIGFVRCTEKVIGPRRRRILSVGPVYTLFWPFGPKIPMSASGQLLPLWVPEKRSDEWPLQFQT